jgi:predicted branched-subunit amino acid permease
MTVPPPSDKRPAYWSTAGLVEGARRSLAVMPALAVFGAGFGTVAAQKGLTLPETALMSGLMFAGPVAVHRHGTLA